MCSNPGCTGNAFTQFSDRGDLQCPHVFSGGPKYEGQDGDSNAMCKEALAKRGLCGRAVKRMPLPSAAFILYAPGPGAVARCAIPGRWEVPKPGMGDEEKVDRSCFPTASCYRLSAQLCRRVSCHYNGYEMSGHCTTVSHSKGAVKSQSVDWERKTWWTEPASLLHPEHSQNAQLCC